MACRYCSRCHQVALFCRTKLSSPLPLGIYGRLLLPMLYIYIYIYAMPSQVGRTVPLWRDISSPKIGSHLSLFPSPSLFRMMCDGVFGYGTPPIACPLRCPSSAMMFHRQVFNLFLCFRLLCWLVQDRPGLVARATVGSVGVVVRVGCACTCAVDKMEARLLPERAR